MLTKTNMILNIFLLYFSVGIRAFSNFANVECGHSSNLREGKIVGGENAVKAEFPWIVSITRRGGHFCGGSLINNKFILTAAHCMCTGVSLNVLKAVDIKVTMAQHNISNKMADAYERSIKNITVHPGYICNKPSNDIAILELENELVWSKEVAPACFPFVLKDHNSSAAVVAGWGWTNEKTSKGVRANVLQKAKVTVFENKKCQQWYKSQGKKTQIKQTQMCAGHEHGGIDACWADSGGPLMTKTGNRGQVMVIGVVSTGIGCGRPYLPGIYTRVSEFLPWIKNTIS